MTTLYQLCIAQSDPAAETWLNASTLGIENITRTRLHAEVDTLTFDLATQTALTDAPIWNYNTLIRFRRIDSGTPTLLFLGRVQPFARSADDQTEKVTVEIKGIWDWFDKTIMRQQWLQPNDNLIYAPHVILYSDGSGQRTTTGAQITQAVQCAIDAGCPVQIGTIPAGHYPPFDEQINVTVADVLIKCLANHPHTVLWIDYTTRTPTLHVATRQSLPVFTTTLTPSQAQHLTITSREDLQPPAVAIAFIRTNTDGDRTYIETTIDHAPQIPGEPPATTQTRLYNSDTLWGTFDLEGSTAQYAEQDITVEPINWDENKNSTSWWQARVPGITDAQILSITNPTGTTNLPNFLIEGAINDWMKVDWATETFTANAKVQRSNSSGVTEIKIEKISFQAITTAATTKTYRKRISYDSGELPPTGLAATMYTEWQQLHHDGIITLTAQETPQGCGPGMTLNITGGRPEWATMAAMITKVTEHYASGSLTIQFGTPAWIDLDSRMAWIRNCRTRRYATSRDLQNPTTDPDTNGGPLAMPSDRIGIQPTTWLRQRFIDPTATTKHEIDINLADITSTTLRTLKIREAQIIVNDSGTLKAQTALILCSTPYGDKEAIGGGHFDLRYNTTNKRLEKQTTPDGAWTMITGGQTVQETV